MRRQPSPKRPLSLIVVAMVGNLVPCWAESVCAAALDPAMLRRTVDQNRPKAIDAEAGAAGLREIPRDRRIRRLSPTDSKKLEGVSDVLRIHGRDAVYSVVVVDLPLAFVGLYNRSAILLSHRALSA